MAEQYWLGAIKVWDPTGFQFEVQFPHKSVTTRISRQALEALAGRDLKTLNDVRSAFEEHRARIVGVAAVKGREHVDNDRDPMPLEPNDF